MDSIEIINKVTDLTTEELQELEHYDKIYYFNYTKKPSIRYSNSKRLLLKNDDCIDYRYKIVGKLGNGAFSDVYKCKDYKDRKYVALKVIKNDSRFHKQVKTEIDIYNLFNSQNVKNENVINLNRNFEFRTNIFLEFDIFGINLYEYLKQHSMKNNVLSFTKQIVSGLEFIHNLGIIHGDLKPENIMIHNNVLKIIDFGSGIKEGSNIINDYIQSRYYRAPDIVYKLPITTKIDIWSLGCILYELDTTTPLIPAKNQNDLKCLFIHILGYPPTNLISETKFPVNPKYPPNSFYWNYDNSLLYKIIFICCLNWNPIKRQTASNILTML